MVNDPFRALAHPIRRGIVEHLAGGPATVGEATAGFGVSKPAISKHLKVLEETGVVTRVVEGRTHRLSSSSHVLGEAADWMDRQRALWGGMFDVVDEYLKEEGAAMNMPPTVSPQEWEAAREELLVKEKELTRARDALAAERRRMPRMAVEKDYPFEGPDGPASLLDLFEGRRQLIVYRFFFEPGVAGWPETRLPGCSLWCDQVAHLAHLNARDTDARVRLARAAARHRALEGADGLGDPLVHDHRRLRRRLRRGRVARHQRLHPRRRHGSSARTSSTAAATRRWAAPGATSTSPRSDARRSGRTRRRATRRPRRTAGGTTTTSTTRRPLRGGPVGRRLATRLEELLLVIAHVGGVPLEELLPTVAGAGAGLLLARAWLERPACRRDPGDERDQTLRMERTYRAPAEAVFEAWTSEEVMRAGGTPSSLGDDEAEVDLRVGGAVRVVMRDPERTPSTAAAALHRDRPAEPAGVHLALGRETRQTLIEIDFEETDGVTTVRFVHSGLWDEEAVRSHEGGWGTFDNLERTLEAARG